MGALSEDDEPEEWRNGRKVSGQGTIDNSGTYRDGEKEIQPKPSDFDDGSIPPRGWREDEEPWRTAWKGGWSDMPPVEERDEDPPSFPPRSPRAYPMRNEQTSSRWWPYSGRGNPRPKDEGGSIWGTVIVAGIICFGGLMLYSFVVSEFRGLSALGQGVWDHISRTVFH